MKKSLLFFLTLFMLTISVIAQGQQRSVSGTVYDSGNNGLPGATVVIKGTTIGTVTDLDGRYTINEVPSDAVLVISFVGMEMVEVPVANQSVINVTLKEESIGLEEVVAIGYGVQKKKLLTGANTNVKGEDIQALNTTTAMDALKGVTPGVSITQNNGQPGASSKISIRGIGTTGDSRPLYIVDGVVQDGIDYLSPNDIESIDVLKDAASAAIYGSRGANGVILVTTKKGQANMKPVITYDGYYGVQNVYKLPDLLNAQEYANILDEALVNSGNAPHNYANLVPDWDKIQSGEWKGTNWFKEMMVDDAPVQSHAVGITGGTAQSNYSFGVSYLDQEGIVGKQSNSFYKRLNVRMNSEHILIKENGNNILTFGENLTYTNSNSNAIRQGNIYWNDVHNALVSSPFLPVYDENGDYHKTIEWNSSDPNPVAMMEYQTKYGENDNNQLVGSFYLVVEPIKNLRLRSSLGFNMYWGNNRAWTPNYNLGPRYVTDKDQVSQSAWTGRNIIQDNVLTYSYKIGEHSFEGMVGNSIERTVQSVNLSLSNKSSLFEDWDHAYIDNTPEASTGNTSIGGRDDFGWSMMSYFGRLSYNYKETLLFSAMLRGDASSRFPEDNRWGYFPSVSAGWVMTNESFMSSTSTVIDFLKLRASWGQVGNERISSFLYSSTMGYLDSGNNFYNWSYGFGDDKTMRDIGSKPARIPNPDIGWETSEQLNIGFDANLLASRLSINFDWYKKDTKDWLVWTPIPSHNGQDGMTINGGNVTNKGVELALGWHDRKGDFSYGATVSVAHNKNEVTAIANSEGIVHGPSNVLSQGTGEIFRAQVGYPIGYFWGYQTDGVIQNDEEAAAWVGPTGAKYFDDQQAGDLRWVDQNEDGVISELDKVQIGDPNPDYILGIQLNFDYKGVFLNATANGAFGQQIAKSYRSFADSYKNNYTTDVFKRWHGEGTSNKYPRLLSSPHRNSQNLSDLYIQDGDYLRISNLTVGYDLKKLVTKLFLSEAKIYFTAKNLYTFTKYDGMDPEIGYGFDYSWASGIDLGLYPSARTYLIGVSLKF
ncbi:SusC/RagA family TonB-linked outer membrane protein [Mangrovibacterium diazotrophicum]|uniref:TonB-linked SusC/RagA family outer membrane protein n=1 Tax=Mangrovibacterium diazotrophicum TaxID=1261403 RepID=A0A419W5B5_9BACT|nr:TonB-dependent receptor [Mangrovibacterium diazotrophicum]RKD90648.1 TonB-linked SusC/RagA family outer membrane protein [Mangrovibacterium diazotrophicum]